MTTVRVLGRLAVERDGMPIQLPPSRRACVVLAYLAIHPGPQNRSVVAARLWPDVPDSSARSSLRGALTELRPALRAASLEVSATRDTVELAGAQLRVDLVEFRRHARAGAHAQALELDRGPLLADLDAEWLAEARAPHARDLLAVLAGLAAVREGEGRWGDAVALARRRADLDPLSEQAGRELIRLLDAAGDRAAALDAGRDLTQRLARELGASPAPETAALLTALRFPVPPRARPRSAGAVGPPPPPAVQRTRPLVGRTGPLAVLRTAIHRPTANVVLIGGAAGIGKSSLALAAARDAAAAGELVLHGRCDEETVVPYAPWLEALGGLVVRLDDDERRLVAGDGGSELARLFPELRPIDHAAERDPDAEPDTRRWRMFEVVAALIGRHAAHRPVVLVLDDVHWADRSSVLLLRHVLRVRANDPLTVLLTARENELPPDGAAAELLARLHRDELLVRVPLTGLGADDVAALVRDRLGRDGGDVFVRALHQETEGNPFFVTEILRNLGGPGAAGEPSAATPDGSPPSFEIPYGVRDLVKRRLARLGVPVQEALGVAAVVGRDFDFAVVTAAGRGEEETLLDALEIAVGAGLIDEIDVGRYSFSHALVRSALYDGLSRTRRSRLHLRVAQVLRSEPPAAGRSRAGELAWHYPASGDPAATPEAIMFSRQAYRDALVQLAYSEAAAHAQRAEQLVERSGPDAELLCVVRLELGEAAARAGDTAGARAAFEWAAGTARAGGDRSALGAAALGFAGPSWQHFGVVDRPSIDLLGEALTSVPDDRPDLRARLAARLAIALYFDRQPDRVTELTASALATARALGEFPVLAAALEARLWDTWRPDGVADRLAAADELLAIARAQQADEVATLARRWRVVALLEAGEIAECWAEIERHAADAVRLRLPYEQMYVAVFDSARAMLDGRLSDAMAGSARVAAFGELRGGADALQFGGVHLLSFAKLSGDLRPLVDGLRQFVEGYPAIPGWRGALAYALAATGRPAEAVVELDRVWPPERELPFDAVWLPGIAFLALTAVELGDRPRAEHLYGLLLPYAGRPVVLGAGGAVWGTISTYLAALADLLGDDEAAQHHRRRADAEVAQLAG